MVVVGVVSSTVVVVFRLLSSQGLGTGSGEWLAGWGCELVLVT